MSHNIEYFSYSENVNKKYVKKELDEYVSHRDYQEGCSGLPEPIDWFDHVCESQDEAKRYIDDHTRHHDYHQAAVKYKVYDPVKPTKKQLELKAKVEELRAKYASKNNKIHYQGVKSEYVSCRACGSRLATKYIKSNNCPLCHNDLRPPSVLETIEAARKAYSKVQGEYAKESKKIADKNKGNYKIRWLVKIEYHT